MKAAPNSNQPVIKKAPTAFIQDEDDEDIGDIDENNDALQKQAISAYRSHNQPLRDENKSNNAGMG